MLNGQEVSLSLAITCMYGPLRLRPQGLSPSEQYTDALELLLAKDYRAERDDLQGHCLLSSPSVKSSHGASCMFSQSAMADVHSCAAVFFVWDS